MIWMYSEMTPALLTTYEQLWITLVYTGMVRSSIKVGIQKLINWPCKFWLTRTCLLYTCICSRKQLIRYRQEHPETPDYLSFCRQQQHDSQHAHAVRLKTFDQDISFTDRLQGKISQNLFQQHGDFIGKRRDQIIAYQLSAVVGEQLQQITEVVRA